jgi:hypothetical protein
MKRTIIACFAFMPFLAALAQTEKGHIMLSGGSDLGFTTGKTDRDQDDNETNFGLNFKAGYFVIDALSAGLNLGYSSFKEGDLSISTLEVGPFLRYYFPFNMFGELGYNFGSQKIDLGDGDATAGTGDLGIGLGYAIFANDVVAFEPMIAYHITSYSPEEGDSSGGSNFGFNFAITVFLGGE